MSKDQIYQSKDQNQKQIKITPGKPINGKHFTYCMIYLNTTDAMKKYPFRYFRIIDDQLHIDDIEIQKPKDQSMMVYSTRPLPSMDELLVVDKQLEDLQHDEHFIETIHYLYGYPASRSVTFLNNMSSLLLAYKK